MTEIPDHLLRRAQRAREAARDVEEFLREHPRQRIAPTHEVPAPTPRRYGGPLLVLLAERWLVRLVKYAMPQYHLHTPGEPIAGHRLFFDQLLIQPCWEPTDAEREWVALAVLVRFGPEDYDQAAAALAPYLPIKE